MSDNEMSRDGDSPDALSRVPPTDIDPETLEKLKQQEREEREEIEKEFRAQRAGLDMSTLSPTGSNNDNNNGSNEGRDLRTPNSSLANLIKEPHPPLGLAGLEAFRREYLTSPLSHLQRGGHSLLPPFPPLGLSQSTAAALQLAAEGGFGKQLHGGPLQGGMGGGSGTPPISRPALGDGMHSRGATPPASQHSTPNSNSEFSSQQNWSFEEQFKQLYELNDDPKRKEFLDDIFNFMQKRGTPINRLPIMAKQVLDLYELYNLVTMRGGLVEVINKKQWQEIIKGLNLPSSITSAAFTLRTQYTKYLYPYECEMKRLSTPTELQQAIDGNKREGRRSGYDTYSMFPGPRPQVPLPPSSLPMPQISPLPPGLRPSSNGFPGFPGSLHHGNRSPPGMNSANPLSALEMTRLALFKMYNQAGMGGPPGGPPGPPGGPLGAAAGINQASLEMGRAMVEQQARMLQAAQLGQREAEAREKETSSKSPQMSESLPRLSQPKDQNNREEIIGISQKRGNNSERSKESSEKSRCDEEDDMSPPPMKRERSDSFDHRNGSPLGMGANIRIANRGESGDSSLVVSLEINSVMYQGVLFAQPGSLSSSKKISSSSNTAATTGIDRSNINKDVHKI